MTAYAANADMLARYDARLLGDLCSDTGIRVPEADLSDDTKLTAALEDASGMVEAALLTGNRYTVDDLSGLTGNSANYLKRIVCEIAMYLLEDRRRYNKDDNARIRAFEKSEEHLEMLRKGAHVFNVQAVKDAGVIDGEVGPSVVELENSHLVRYRTRNFYPRARTPGNR